jgi:hydroxymethylpyrimidine/phosphomethylpyrimidine kinase
MTNTATPAAATLPVALTIAGSDSSGGAGIQADLKTFQALGVFGMSAVTAVTVQNTQKVYAIQEMAPHIVHDQIVCLFEDAEIQAVKIGMVAGVELIEAIAAALGTVRRVPVVLDPVMVSKSGYALLKPEARQALMDRLFPLATVVTPNIPEAELLIGAAIADLAQMRSAAQRIARMGVPNVVIKGGHLGGGQAVDVLYDGSGFCELSDERIATRNTHGTGCTFSSAIAAWMARGCTFPEAAQRAKRYVTGAIANSLAIGKGHGPTHHFYDLYARAGMTTGCGP